MLLSIAGVYQTPANEDVVRLPRKTRVERVLVKFVPLKQPLECSPPLNSAQSADASISDIAVDEPKMPVGLSLSLSHFGEEPCIGTKGRFVVHDTRY